VESHIRAQELNMDPWRREDRENQFRWLKEKLELINRVFGARIKRLELPASEEKEQL